MTFFFFFTSDNFSSCVWLALQERQQHRRLVCAVHAGLNRLLEHWIDRSWAEVVWKLLHQLPVKMWAVGSVLVHIDANWKHTNLKINHSGNFNNFNVQDHQVEAFIQYTCANYIWAVSMVVLCRDVTAAQSGLWRRSWNWWGPVGLHHRLLLQLKRKKPSH